METLKRNRWTHEEVQALLSIYGEADIQRLLGSTMRNDRVYAQISQRLVAMDIQHNSSQVREKLKKLKHSYKQMKGNNARCRNGWYDMLDSILGHRPPPAASPGKSQSAQDSAPGRSKADEPRWEPDEVQVLITLWAQENIQKQLGTSETTQQVYTFLSSELALVGFKKTASQCSRKVDELKKEYKKFKQDAPNGHVPNDWFVILGSVLEDNEKAANEVGSIALKEHVNDESQAVWTSDEVRVLLTRWSQESIQEQLRSNPSSERAFALLSSELATQGFDKSTIQCRIKIGQLKIKYQRIKGQKNPEKQRGRWFALIDKVLGPGSKREPGVTDTSSLQAPKSLPGCHLSTSSLCLLVPTLRLMCAFAWQVVQSCNVLHYVKVEELVRSVTDLVPSLLTPTERVQLLLKLRARLVLELCREECTANLHNVQPHLKVIQGLAMSSSCGQEEMAQLESSKSNFAEVVYALLDGADERRRFFKEVFPLHFDRQFELSMKTLFWKFVSKVDSLLPVPDITQTAMLISNNTSVFEECGRLVLDSDQLKDLLLFHHQQLGYTNTCFSRPQNMFLPTLSLRPKENSKRFASEQREEFAGGEDEKFYDSEDEGQADGDVDPEGGRTRGQNESDGATAASDSNLTTFPQPQWKCSLWPYSDSEVPGHMETKHPSQTAESGKQVQTSQDQTYKCQYCEKVFDARKKLNVHVKSHTLPFSCDTCDKKYASNWTLTVHRRIHTGETPYLCSHCGKGFRSASFLELHNRIHSGEPRYKCNICGKTSNQHLTRHMRMHRQEKNYLCTECGKAFTSAAELKLHTRYHTGERPYKCKPCGRGFVSKSLLSVHMRSHTGEKPYECSRCSRSFTTVRLKKRHMKIHANKKSFPCVTCGKLFMKQKTLKAHLETHGDIKEEVEK